MPRLDRITSDPAVCHGQPTVRGLRYPVESLLELLSAGMTIDEVLADYPDLERDDLLAALEFGAQLPARLARFLSDAGHDALHTSEPGPRQDRRLRLSCHVR
jgi:uncharacterized protein (DUF433 family)